MRPRLLGLVVCFFCFANAQCELVSAAVPVQYLVSFADADRHVIDVQVTIPTAGAEQVEAMMPVWTPGSYLVREYAKNIESIAAFDPLTAEPLEITKTAKNRWSIRAAPGAEAVQIRYQLYCREMSVRTNWVDRDFAVLNGAATFVTSPALLDRPHLVRFVVAPQWSTSVTSLAAEGVLPHTYRAKNFDELVDSPVVLGNPKIANFEVSGVPHKLVTVNDAGLWDNQRAAEDVQRIVQTQHDFWGTVPYQSYIFFNVVGEAGGGLEHDNGTLLMTSRWTFGDADRYRSWLGLVSHELFHAWNVRRLRPKALATYDYESENYFNELWIAEGVTSYYDNLLQKQAGLLTEADYLKQISGTLKNVMTSPGNLVQSLRESSYDSWIKHYRPDENSNNVHISYYTKGSLVAWLLDAKIRVATNGEKSLRDVMRILYQQYAIDGGGYELADFRAVVDQVAGNQEPPLSQWLVGAVDQTAVLDFQPALDWWGLSLGDAKEPSGTELDEVDSSDPDKDEKTDENADEKTDKDLPEPAASAVAKNPQTPYLGASVREQAGRMIVSRIVRGSPADLAGWNVDDELLAVGEFRATDSLLSQHLHQFPIGKPVETLLSRRGQLIHRDLVLGEHRTDGWQLKPLKKPSEAQQQQRKAWLRGD